MLDGYHSNIGAKHLNHLSGGEQASEAGRVLGVKSRQVRTGRRNHMCKEVRCDGVYDVWETMFEAWS